MWQPPPLVFLSRLTAWLNVLQKPALMVSCFPDLQGPSQLQIGDVAINLQSGLNQVRGTEQQPPPESQHLASPLVP